MKCYKCGADLEPEEIYCRQCGTEVIMEDYEIEEKTRQELQKENVSRYCIYCGNLLIKGAFYCQVCGNSILYGENNIQDNLNELKGRIRAKKEIMVKEKKVLELVLKEEKEKAILAEKEYKNTLNKFLRERKLVEKEPMRMVDMEEIVYCPECGFYVGKNPFCGRCGAKIR